MSDARRVPTPEVAQPLHKLVHPFAAIEPAAP